MQIGQFNTLSPSFLGGGFSFLPLGGGQPNSLLGPSFPGGASLIGLLTQVLQSFTQLGQGWSGYLGGGPATPGFGPGGPGQLSPGLYGSGARPTGFVGYGGGASFNPNPGFGPTGQGMPGPTDPGEFASYLQAQRLGGSLQGKTGIAQNDAIPGTRFGSEPDPTLWHASVARNYAAQFAAYAIGADPLTAQGLQQGQNAFPQMAPEAQLFMQVASVFKGNMFNGPGNYDNPGLGRLLQSTGNGDLINNPQVGQTDVQTIGAITQALNRGTLTLNQVIQSGTIDNLDRYSTIINYVQSGGFRNDVSRYESRPF